MSMFLLPIGDWSDDGHGKCEWFGVESPQELQEWREAYFLGCEKWPELAPDNELFEKEELQEKIKSIINMDIYGDKSTTEWFADYTINFCKAANPNLVGNIVRENKSMFQFYGVDDKGRHIGHIGYDAFEY